jgi:hypothetical protein
MDTQAKELAVIISAYPDADRDGMKRFVNRFASSGVQARVGFPDGPDEESKMLHEMQLADAVALVFSPQRFDQFKLFWSEKLPPHLVEFWAFVQGSDKVVLVGFDESIPGQVPPGLQHKKHYNVEDELQLHNLIAWIQRPERGPTPSAQPDYARKQKAPGTAKKKAAGKPSSAATTSTEPSTAARGLLPVAELNRFALSDRARTLLTTTRVLASLRGVEFRYASPWSLLFAVTEQGRRDEQRQDTASWLWRAIEERDRVEAYISVLERAFELFLKFPRTSSALEAAAAQVTEVAPNFIALMELALAVAVRTTQESTVRQRHLVAALLLSDNLSYLSAKEPFTEIGLDRRELRRSLSAAMPTLRPTDNLKEWTAILDAPDSGTADDVRQTSGADQPTSADEGGLPPPM